MLNKAPIFINAFSRGGSNILWNLFQTHPNVCSPIFETDEIFQPRSKRGRIGKINHAIVSLLSVQPKLFNARNLSPRRRIPKCAMHYIDIVLFREKMKNLEHEYNKYKFENLKYTYNEVKNSRLVSKNLNGTVFLTDLLYEMYPDATFISLVRNGLALCESHLRRGFPSASEFGKRFKKITQKMIQDSQKIERYYIVKFEDILNDPVKSLKLLYQHANLNVNDIEKIRLKSKYHFDEKGKRITKYVAPGNKIWLTSDELSNFLDPKINEYHISRLSEEDKKAFMKVAQKSMNQFSYD